jgi:uncharacterized protein (DUF1810 family)
VDALLQVVGRSAEQIMGDPDFRKLHSSMTLFAAVSPTGSQFQRLLEIYYAGRMELKTLDFLSGE